MIKYKWWITLSKIPIAFWGYTYDITYAPQDLWGSPGSNRIL